VKKRLPIVIAAVVLLLGGGIAWWKLRGGDAPKPAAAAQKDPWASAALDLGAIAEEKRAAHGDAAADATPASVSGRVTRRADGAGVAGAVVSLSPEEISLGEMGVPMDDRMVLAIADDQGAWSATGIAPGTYVVTATATGLLPGSLDGIALAAGAQKSGLHLVLDAGGATVRGTVTDIGGGPIADARVRAMQDDMAAFRGKKGGYVAVTGADGTYQLTLPDGAWNAVATQVDYTSARKSFALAGQPITVDFRLTPGATIRGQVVSRIDGVPVPGAVVRASGGTTGSRREGNASAVADAEGNFTLKGLGSGSIKITATARGYASTAPTRVALGIGESVDGVKVLVDRGLTIAGFVVKRGDERTGIAGVQVGAFSLGTQEGAISAQPSGPDGYFEILGLHPANYLLFAIGRDVMPDVGKPVSLKDTDVTNVIIVMDVGTSLSGKVEPPAVATMSLEVDDEKIGFSNMFDVMKAVMVAGESDASGAFTVRNAPTGSYTLVAKTRDGRIGRLPVDISDKDQTGLVVKLEDRGAISGRVVDATGAPVASVQVEATPAGDRGMSFRMDGDAGAVTGADGAFTIRGLDSGKHGLTVSDEQGNLGWADPKKERGPHLVEITGSSEVTGVTLAVEPRDGVIRGVVLGTDGKPARDAWVRATLLPDRDGGRSVTISVGSSGGDMRSEGGEDQEEVAYASWRSPDPVLSGDDGRFTIDRLRRGSHQVVAEGPNGATRARKSPVKIGENVTLVLETLGSIAGVVRAGGAPVADYTITCDGPADPETQHVIAEDGAYTFDRRPAGKYTCTVVAENGTATGTVTVKTAAAALDLEIGAWGSISGTIVDARTGAPIAGLKLAAMGAGGTPTGIEELLTGGGASTDQTGRFEIGKQTAGKGQLMAFDGGLTGFHVVAHKDYTLAPGQKLDLGVVKGLAPRSGPAGSLGLATEERDGKLVVKSVTAGGPAETAGVKAGDAITAIDGRSVAELTLELAGDALDAEHVAAGQVVVLSLARGGTTSEASITAIAVP
jgi:hypothetical protein